MAKASLETSVDTIVSECIAVRLRMLNRVVTNLFDESLRPLGVKVSQMNILVATAKMGTARPADICRHLHLDVSTLSRNVDRMKARGWLEVVEDTDARSHPFRLTAAGKKLLEKAFPAWESAQAKAVALLGSDMVEQCDAALAGMKETI